jgi:hypothetical protein
MLSLSIKNWPLVIVWYAGAIKAPMWKWTLFTRFIDSRTLDSNHLNSSSPWSLRRSLQKLRRSRIQQRRLGTRWRSQA